MQLEGRINMITGSGGQRAGCNHTDYEYITPECGNRHCIPCLREHIRFQKNTGIIKIKCFCNVEMGAAVVAQVTGVRQTSNVHLWDKLNKSTVAVSSKLSSCDYCKKQIKDTGFTEVTCPDHRVCIKCHVETFRKSKGRCPLNDRDYSDTEIVLLNRYNEDYTKFS